MHYIRIDAIKNRLYINLGIDERIDVADYVNELENACKYLIPGFTCLIDLNKKKMVRQSDKDLLFNTADLVYAYGAGKIIHIRKNDETMDIFKKSKTSYHNFFPVEIAQNIQEAENILESNIWS